MIQVMKCQYSGSSLHTILQYGQYIILNSVVCHTILPDPNTAVVAGVRPRHGQDGGGGSPHERQRQLILLRPGNQDGHSADPQGEVTVNLVVRHTW